MLKQQLQIKLSQKLSPQQIQLMKMIQLSTLELEQKITIMSTHLSYEDGYTKNVVDTPGQADFVGEVDRILGMVSSVCLIIDAAVLTSTPSKTDFFTSTNLSNNSFIFHYPFHLNIDLQKLHYGPTLALWLPPHSFSTRDA